MGLMKNVLILGAGVGGIVAAHQLRKLLPRSCRIILIDRADTHYFAPSFLWLMTGERTPDQISRPLKNLNRKGIEFICDEIESINPQEKIVRTKKQEFKGDAIIIALGCEYNSSKIPGLSDAGATFYTLEGAQAIAKQLNSIKNGKIAILTAAAKYKCPAAPYEASMLIDSFCREKGVRKNVQIDFYAAEGNPMATGGPAVSAAVRQMLDEKKINYHPDHQAAEINPLTREIKFSNGAFAAFDLLLFVPPHEGPKILKGTALVSESGWIPVNPKTLETRFPDVYAIGDVNTITLKIGKPMPKAGVFAHGEAEVVASNIVSKWKGKAPARSYDGVGYCFVEAGAGRAGIGIGYFYEDVPRMKLHPPSRFWHWGKIIFEKYWLWKWF